MKKRYLPLVFLLFFFTTTSAQTFEPTDTLYIPGLTEIKSEFADIDNDGNFELLVMGRADSSAKILPLVLSLRENGWQIDTLLIDSLASSTFILSDVDNDNQLDIVGVLDMDSTSALTVFYQTADFEFGHHEIVDTLFSPYFAIEDWNTDGSKELIYTFSDSLGHHMRVLDRKAGSWQEDTTFLHVPYGPQLVFDFDKNGAQDIFIAGADSLSQAYSMLISNKNDTISIKDSIYMQLKEPSLSLGDFNHDGVADILAAGIGSDSLFHSLLYLSGIDSVGMDSLQIESMAFDSLRLDTLGIVKDPDYFMADLNSDGLTDIVLKGLNDKDSLVNVLLINSPAGGYSVEQLDTSFVAGSIQRFGDLNCDGNPEKVLINPAIDSLGSKVIFYKNLSVPNQRVDPALSLAAFQMENQILLFWEDMSDDKTPPQSITHDVIVTSGSAGIMMPGFDRYTLDRLMVKHGNNGYNNKVTVRNLEAGVYEYAIQSVDNAFGPSGCPKGEAGVCKGNFTYCEDLIGTEEVSACYGQTVTLSARDEHTGWYSVKKGFLGFSRSVSLRVTAGDTVFNDASGAIPCRERRKWIIKLEHVKLKFPDVSVCKDELKQFQLKEPHDSVKWISTSRGLLSDASIMEVATKVADTVVVQAYKNSCHFLDTFYISVIAPEIVLNGKQFKIYGGQSVQLEASGVVSYSWSPSEGLDDADIPDPIASPLVNTTYQVTGVDKRGCEVIDSIQVFVEHAAFLATLFTPNEDAKNDIFLLYGIADASDFSFRVYNRAGNMVYETTNVSEATSLGWDGTAKGKPQPTGIYYWKVTGIFPDGKKVLLNGKEEGALHLIR